MKEDLDAVGGEPILDDGGGVKRGVVPLEKPTLLNQHRPLLPQMLHEDIQDLHNVCGIDSGAPGEDMRIDKTIAVEGSEHQLFCQACLGLGLYWARLPLLDPLLGLFFSSEACDTTPSSHPW